MIVKNRLWFSKSRQQRSQLIAGMIYAMCLRNFRNYEMLPPLFPLRGAFEVLVMIILTAIPLAKVRDKDMESLDRRLFNFFTYNINDALYIKHPAWQSKKGSPHAMTKGLSSLLMHILGDDYSWSVTDTTFAFNG